MTFKVNGSYAVLVLILALGVSSVVSSQVQTDTYRSSPVSSFARLADVVPLSPDRNSIVFNFVSNFENLQLDGWKSETGTAPTVFSTPNYSGEPALQSSASGGSQIDFANQGFIKKLGYLYFQVAMNVSSDSKGYFGIGRSSKSFVAIVGVQSGDVVAGGSLKSLQTVESIPSETAYPAGWVDILGYIINDYNSSSIMRVYVDRTDVIAANVSVPDVGNYTGALIETTKGTVDYSDIVVSSFYGANTNPGYVSQDGYWLGCCNEDALLPAFFNLSAVVTLNSWSIPQNNTLSFQINTGNLSSADNNTCVGFFQLGVDFNSKGSIAPWHVNGNNCRAHYFNGNFEGLSSPAGTVLTLSIVWNSTADKIQYEIVDVTLDKTFSASIPYSGQAFYSALTQLEFLTGTNTSSISNYKVNETVSSYQITKVGSAVPQDLNSTEQFPFYVNAPPSWDLTYYNDATAGYAQLST